MEEEVAGQVPRREFSGEELVLQPRGREDHASESLRISSSDEPRQVGPLTEPEQHRAAAVEGTVLVLDLV